MIRLDGVIHVGQRLCFDPLGAIDNQQRSFNRAHRTRHFIGKVNVARCIYQVQDVFFTVLRGVIDPNGLRLDRNAAFSLDIHAVEHLLFHVAVGHGVRRLDQPVSERRLSVVDMRHD